MIGLECVGRKRNLPYMGSDISRGKCSDELYFVISQRPENFAVSDHLNVKLYQSTAVI